MVQVLVAIVSGYILYVNDTKTFNIKDVSIQEAFKVYMKTNDKPSNIDLLVNGTIDSAFNIRIVGLPSQAILFDSTFTQKAVDYKCKIDFYEGNGAEIFYLPKGAKEGQVKIGAVINAGS
ncbi:hypothetical protein GCM10027185_31410 [Spirosoma pulveris]